VFRSDDKGATWVRINGNYGFGSAAANVMTADADVYGRGKNMIMFSSRLENVDDILLSLYWYKWAWYLLRCTSVGLNRLGLGTVETSRLCTD